MPYEQCKPVYDLLNWKPNGPEQAAAVQEYERYPCLFGGERSGKSTAAEKIGLPHVLALPHVRPEEFKDKNGRIKFDPKVDKPRRPHMAIFGPRYKECQAEFEMLEEDLRELGKLCEPQLSKPENAPWRLVTTDGVVVRTWSLENPESVRSVNLELAMVVEAGGCPYAGIERIRGRVAARRGPIIYNGTIEHAQTWWRDWQAIGQRPNTKHIKTFIIPSWANRIEFPGGRDDPEIKEWMEFLGEDLAMERLAAVARPPRFRVLKEAKPEHVKLVTPPEDARLEIAIDPGYATAYSILFCYIWKENGDWRFHFADELYEQNKNTHDMIELCKQKPRWPSIVEGAIDIASKGHRDATDSSLEIWQKMTHVNLYKKYWAEDRQIERLQTSFRLGQITIDPKCEGLLAECGLGEPVFPEMHPWKFFADRDGRIQGEKPIDRWNHCHDDKTDILTERGWVPFPELRDEDAVAVWGEGMQFEVPESVIRDEYDGPLLVHEGKQLDFAVTPNHRMWVANQMSVMRNRAPEYRFVEAQNLDGRTWVNRVAPGWRGEDPIFSFRQRTKTGYHVATPEPAKLARFVGFWLAEGCLGRGGGKHYVIVDQKKHVEVAREIVRDTGLNWCETTRKDGVVRFSIQSQELYAYLCPPGAHSVAETKRVPREWVNATPPTISALLDGYRVGDGSYWGREGWWYGSSVSKPLLDDLQEMCFRAGLISNVYKARDADPEFNRLTTWYLGVRPSDGPQTGFGLVRLHRENIREQNYSGTVYCVTTKAGVIATRRNGRVMWGGNSAKAAAYLILKHAGQAEWKRKPTSFNRLNRKKNEPEPYPGFASPR